MIGPNAKERMERHALKVEGCTSWRELGGGTGESNYDSSSYVYGYIDGAMTERARNSEREKALVGLLSRARDIVIRAESVPVEAINWKADLEKLCPKK